MSRTLKKSVSLLLSVIMVLSIFTVVPFTASAADGEGQPRRYKFCGVDFY